MAGYERRELLKLAAGSAAVAAFGSRAIAKALAVARPTRRPAGRSATSSTW